MRNLLVLIFFISGIISSYAQKAPDVAKNKIEDFHIFIGDFSSSKEFQISRLSKNMIECEITIKGDSSCSHVGRESWRFIKLVTSNELELIYDNFQLKTNDTDERVYSIEDIEGGSGTYYYFKRIEGKWYLVKRVIYL